MLTIFIGIVIYFIIVTPIAIVLGKAMKGSVEQAYPLTTPPKNIFRA